MQAIVTLGEATAFQVSQKTGRSRAAESDYLNQLVDRGFLKKARGQRNSFSSFQFTHALPYVRFSCTIECEVLQLLWSCASQT
jgi:hypothetical protein